jgi:hypothetical protein
MTLFILLVLTIHVQSGYDLMVFGDTGENEVFRQYEYKKKGVPGALSISDIDAEVNYDKWTCKVTEGRTNPKVTHFNKVHTGLANWERVLGANLPRVRAANEVIILGDMVYPESKWVSDTTNNNGGVQWLEPTSLSEDDKRAKYWERRRNCGWAAFFRSFDHAGSDLGMETTANNNVMHPKLIAMPGNHLYDVSPKEEIKFMDAMFPGAHAGTVVWYSANTRNDPNTGKSWHNAVRMDTKTIAGGRTHTSVVFIDFNSSLLELSASCNGLTKDQCLGNIQTALNSKGKYWMAKAQVKPLDVYNHNEGLFHALAAASQVASAYIVLRAHHPPFNLEGDFMAFAKYPMHTDLDGWKGLTVLQAFKKAKVAVYLASHHHSAQILAFPYSKVGDLKTKDQRSRPQTTVMQWLKCLNQGQPCGNTAPEFSYNVDWANPKYLFIVLVGNSGRYFDPIETDDRTYATLIWGRAGSADAIPEGEEDTVKSKWKNPDNSPKYYYGGAKVNFSDAGIKVRFHEVKPGQTTTDPTAALLLNTANASDAIDYVDRNVASKLARRRNRMKRRHH